VARFVLDASVATAWLLDDEEEALSNVALARLETDEALVPQLWHVEVRSALLAAERRGRIRSDEVDERLRSLGDLPVRTDTDPRFGAVLALARTHRLSMYDAMYLELAQRLDAPLATLDKALARTCHAAGLVPDWDPRAG
jgi:predicted nucleic acid-binding protein